MEMHANEDLGAWAYHAPQATRAVCSPENWRWEDSHFKQFPSPAWSGIKVFLMIGTVSRVCWDFTESWFHPFTYLLTQKWTNQYCYLKTGSCYRAQAGLTFSVCPLQPPGITGTGHHIQLIKRFTMTGSAIASSKIYVTYVWKNICRV